MSENHFRGRTLARSQGLQLIFQAEATGRSVDEVLASDFALSEGPLDPFAEMLARGTWELEPGLDRIIAEFSTNWSPARMPSVDRNLLRLSLYEILDVDEVELPVTIDECVVLAKAYGTDESSRFVNGVLGRIARELEAGRDLASEAKAETEAAGVRAAEAALEAETEPEPEVRETPAYGAQFREEAEEDVWSDGSDDASWDRGDLTGEDA